MNKEKTKNKNVNFAEILTRNLEQSNKFLLKVFQEIFDTAFLLGYEQATCDIKERKKEK